MAAAREVSIVVPLLDEAEILPELIHRLHGALASVETS